jgi:hypothetical protein
MILTNPTKTWAPKFIVLDPSYLELFNQALKNQELNKMEDKNKPNHFIKRPLKTEKAG